MKHNRNVCMEMMCYLWDKGSVWILIIVIALFLLFVPVLVMEGLLKEMGEFIP